MESLLAEFYTKIRGSQEDIASQGLVYVLNHSECATDAIVGLLKKELSIEIPTLTFRAQTTGENLERPDISGYDESGIEKVIVEAKFWAALTSTQPVEYLKRLLINGGVLLFVCPSLRKGLLWRELERRIDDSNLTAVYHRENHLAEFGDGRFVLVMTWDRILAVVKDAVDREDDAARRENLRSDVNQIIGFCRRIDNDSFLPIQDSDLSPAIGRRMYSYYSLVDKVLNKMISQGKVEVDLSRLRATPHRSGYVRYFRSNGLALFLGLNFEYWFSHAETPFWLGLNMASSPSWNVTENLRKACRNFHHQKRKLLVEIDGTPYFPLIPMINETEDVVVASLAKYVEDIISGVSQYLSNPTNENL